MRNPTRRGKAVTLLMLLLRTSARRGWRICLCDPKDGSSRSRRGQGPAGSDGDTRGA
jgi:hypothetical protein